MRQQLKFLVISLALLTLVAFVLFVVNQVAGIYTLAKAVHPGFGLAVLWSLILLFVGLFSLPVYLYLRLPKPLPLPENDEGRVAYFQALGKRLGRNRLLTGEQFNWTEEKEIQRALTLLDNRADNMIQNTAKSVFLTTAISQNGKLDALTVLITHSKLVWDIAHVYYQRPSLRDLTTLYANVGATTFMASQIEDIDLSEHLEPVLGNLLQNSALKSVPFVGSVSGLIMDSLMEGTVNAFLTLRVGIITKRYCGSLTTQLRGQVRRAAYREAAGMLGQIVRSVSGQVVRSITDSVKRSGANTVKSGLQVAGRASDRVRSWFGNATPNVGPTDG